jgi:hypothetical protein
VVERQRSVAHADEGGLAALGELDHVDSAVGGIAAAGEQAIRLHRVEVMGQGGLADADRCGQLALVGHLTAHLEVEEHEPHWHRAAGLAERLVEGAADDACRAREVQADGRGAWRRHRRKHNSALRYRRI